LTGRKVEKRKVQMGKILTAKGGLAPVKSTKVINSLETKRVAVEARKSKRKVVAGLSRKKGKGGDKKDLS